MIWIAATITLSGVCAAASLAVDRLPYVTLGTFWATSLIGQIFALPLMVLALGLVLFAEGIALPLLGVAAVLLAIAHWKNRAAGRALLNAVGLEETRIPALAGLTPLLTGASKVRRILTGAVGSQARSGSRLCRSCIILLGGAGSALTSTIASRPSTGFRP